MYIGVTWKVQLVQNVKVVVYISNPNHLLGMLVLNSRIIWIKGKLYIHGNREVHKYKAKIKLWDMNNILQCKLFRNLDCSRMCSNYLVQISEENGYESISLTQRVKILKNIRNPKMVSSRITFMDVKPKWTHVVDVYCTLGNVCK